MLEIACRRYMFNKSRGKKYGYSFYPADKPGKGDKGLQVLEGSEIGYLIKLYFIISLTIRGWHVCVDNAAVYGCVGIKLDY